MRRPARSASGEPPVPPASDPALVGLKWLARRELTERQVRDRLAKKGYSAEAIDQAISRLKQDRALDDERTARAFVSTVASLNQWGPARIRLALERLGVDRAVARAAMADVLGKDAEAANERLEAALDRRLRGRSIGDAADMRRHHQWLLRQGFDGGAALQALKRRLAGTATRLGEDLD